MIFKRVAILGAGLLGGSTALALRKFSPGTEVSLWGRRDHFFPWAEANGIDCFSTDLAAAIKGADLVVLSTPVGFMAGLVEQTLSLLPEGQSVVFTDVGSVKRLVTEQIKAVIEASGHAGVSFVGSHPMAGSEKSGCQDSKADLFVDKACVIESGRGELTASVESFWKTLGARTVLMNPEEHDRTVAAISHFPHAVASLTTEVALAGDAELATQVMGNGFLDTTRIASGNAAMWAEIMLSNREALLDQLKSMEEQTRSLIEMLERGDSGKLETLLQSAKDQRDALS